MFKKSFCNTVCGDGIIAGDEECDDAAAEVFATTKKEAREKEKKNATSGALEGPFGPSLSPPA